MPSHYPIFSLARWCFAVGVLAIFLAVSGCTHTKVVTSYDCANAIVKDTTVTHYLWGLVQAKDIHPPCDPRFNYINRVELKTTFGNFFLAFITAGIVIKQKLNYCCAPPNIPTGDLNNP